MNFSELLDAVRRQRILVVGDVMLDEYVFGTARRVSPEAPVIVLDHQRTQTLPGGAANVAKNVLAFGASTHLVGVTGADDTAKLLEQALNDARIDHTLIPEPSRQTTRKTRVLAGASHQVVRVDAEDTAPIGCSTVEALMAVVQDHLASVDAVLLSDYCKGCLPEQLVRMIHQAAKAAWKPVIVNAKPQSVDAYRGATTITLNRQEASAASGTEVSASNALDVAESLRERHRAEAIVVTLGDEGMAVAGPESFLIPAHRVEVADPAGAGDTVAATTALGLAAVGFQREVFELASRAAACVVGHVGVSTVSPADLEAITREDASDAGGTTSV